MSESGRLAVVAGPTASGKTALAVRLARRFDGEVVSADSMQIYRGMDIGTAKPDDKERLGIPHHMMDFLDLGEEYSAARYAEDASACVRDILGRGRIPIVAGGTGFYVDALLGGVSFERETGNKDIREELAREADNKGMSAMYERLKTVDPEYAAKTHENNRKRVLRALEIYELTGQAPTDRLKRMKASKPGWDSVKFGLNFSDRAELYARINARVDEMFKRGLEEEARRVFERGPGSTAAQAIGYKELFEYFRGETTLNNAKEVIARRTRNYAKRQLTWFRRYTDIIWLDAADPDGAFERASGILCRSL